MFQHTDQEIEQALTDLFSDGPAESANIKLIDQLQLAINQLTHLTPGQIVTPNDKRIMRKGIFVLVSLALISEIGYAFLQYNTSSSGWEKVLGIKELAILLAAIGTALDFIVNIWTTSPGNDANSNVFMSATKLSPAVEMLKWCAIAISCGISYPAGATGNIQGVLPYLLPHPEKATDGYYYGFILPLTALVTLVGTSYYTTFNVRAMVATFELLGKYFAAPKADNNFYRWMEMIKEGMCVFAFRAGGFAAIAVSTIVALGIEFSTAEKMLLAAVVFIATVLNVAATRLKYTVTSWSNNDFAYILPEEKKEALKRLTYDNYLSLSTGANISMSIGLMMMGNSDNRLLLLIPAGLSLLNNLMAQRDLAANKDALSNIGDEVIKQRRRDLLKSEQGEMVDDVESQSLLGTSPEVITTFTEKQRNERINAAAKAFEALSATFANDVLVQRFSSICCAGSVTSRGLGFISFTEVLSLLFGLDLPSTTVIGIALLLAPPNLRNLFLTFNSNMVETIAQKLAEAYVNYSADTGREEQSFSAWAKSHKAVFFTTLYTKAAIDYKAEEIQSALELRKNSLIS